MATGYFIGAAAGLTTGILVGWSKRWSYWVNPLIKMIGPIPPTAWVPIALVSFPTTFSASVFLIALAVWFPTAVLTSSGISNVQNSFFEVSSTLGAKTLDKIFKVALPAAMPSP
ncbi:MAG: ABC transporter permease subunit [Clostridia bacterium]|nr:ABC transporter permease subunit [Clostridia bacterium]